MNARVDLLTEVEMYQHFEAGIRGGMCFVKTYFVEAHNTETVHGHMHPREQNYISYWDENNLYGNALRQRLPCGEFQWMTEDEWTAINWQTVDVEGVCGYALKVDLSYPQELHERTKDFPLAPVSTTVSEDMFTCYMRDQWQVRSEIRHQPFKTEKKLLMTCYDKIEYVVHFKLLQFYLNMGMQNSFNHQIQTRPHLPGLHR